MIDYIKMVLLAIFAGITAPLPASSSAHFSLVNDIVGFSDDGSLLGFYFSAFSIVFAILIFFHTRKIYLNCFKAIFTKDEAFTGYKKTALNIFLSVIMSAVLLIPVSSEKLVIDYLDTFLTESGLILTAIASVFCALVLVVAIWYSRQNYAATKRTPGTRNVLRTSLFQLVSYVVPGMSPVAVSGTNLILCDIDSKVLLREIYVYLAPQMLTVSLIRVIRFILTDAVIDPVLLIIGSVVFAIVSLPIIKTVSKVNIRRLFPFFSIYSAIFGILAGILSFVI